MIFAIHQDGHIYPAREMLDAMEDVIQKDKTRVELLSIRISNSLQV